MGLAAILLPALLTGLVASRSGKAQQLQRVAAVPLTREGIEAVRVVREAGWEEFAVNGIYHPLVSSGTWTLALGEENVDGFTRSITISDVMRGPAGEIVAFGGTPDPSTKLVNVTVAWDLPTASSVNIPMYVTRYMDNLTWLQTSEADFNAGINTGTAVENTSGGEVVLGGGGHGDWCKPALTQWGFNLNHSASGTAIAAVSGKVFVVTGNNNASETFYDVNISDTYPPIAVSAGVLTGQKKAYGVFGDQTYAYIATDTQKKQGTIIRLSDHQETGWLDLGNASINGRSVVVINNYAYLSGTDNKIYIFDVSTKTGTLTAVGNVSLSGIGHKLVQVGGKLFVAIDATSNQLAIIPITGGGSTLGTPEYVTVTGQSGRDVFVNGSGTRAYLATSAAVSQDELFVVDTESSSPTFRNVLSSQDTNGMDPTGVVAVTNNKVVIVGLNGYEYQVYNYNDSAKIFSTCSGGAGYLNMDSGIRGIASVVEGDGDAFSYLITGDGAQEFKIIEGGPNGQASGGGTFESSVFDAGKITAFNRFEATSIQPSLTNVRIQVAVAAPAGGDCSTASYVYLGPDGTGVTYFGNSGVIPLVSSGGYQNPGQCFKYRVYLSSTDLSASPIFEDIVINYSP
jgi:hypothetical protein